MFEESKKILKTLVLSEPRRFTLLTQSTRQRVNRKRANIILNIYL